MDVYCSETGQWNENLLSGSEEDSFLTRLRSLRRRETLLPLATSSLLLRIMRSCIGTTAIMLKSMAPLMIVQP
ncbi:hypothetical protein NC653_011770 [Populus alba x Populus x berolinensis]|uniref:Uncharacterized protein n=1 Tax=Populus alba x Populus x berolinensis TaxID=444605 RepID=A0AAD6R485_9ROSI|nr:hypothetical protein NC653_011770 [Populus alba x Populus x berolinensis]